MLARFALPMSLVLLMALTAGPVRGQEPKDAIQLFNMASELAEKGRYEEAITIWVDIAEELPAKYLPIVQLNLGLAYQNMERLSEAWHHLNLARKLSKPGDRIAADELKEVSKELIGTHVKVLIFTQPDGGTVYFGEKAEGLGYRSPLTWWMEPGKYKVYAVNIDHKPKVVEFQVKHGTSPYHSVKIDMVPLLGGDQIIEVPGADARGLQGTGWALVGGGATVALVGGVLSIAANARNEGLYDKYTGEDYEGMGGQARQELYDAEYDDDVRPKKIASYVLYGVGGAAAVAGAIVLILDAQKKKTRSGVSVAPWMGGEATGAVLSLEF